MSKWGEPDDYGLANRPAFSAQQLAGMGVAVAVVAHAPVEWIAKTFGCSEKDAQQFKRNASLDFFQITLQAKQVMGR